MFSPNAGVFSVPLQILIRRGPTVLISDLFRPSLYKKFIREHNELKRGKKCNLVGQLHCLPQRLKSTFFEIILSEVCPKKGPTESEFFFKC